MLKTRAPSVATDMDEDGDFLSPNSRLRDPRSLPQPPSPCPQTAVVNWLTPFRSLAGGTVSSTALDLRGGLGQILRPVRL